MEWDRALQRLFSTFPSGWPGVGLLLFRVGLSARLIFLAISDISTNASEPAILAPNIIAIAGSFFLLAGLWTPAMGAMVALDEAWIALAIYSPRHGDTWIRVFLAVLPASLAMLGPGAWSIDARLFGRKRFDIDRTRR